MIFAASILLTAGVLAFVLFVRSSDLPEAVAESPIRHLEERKAVIYDNLRDLNFEYRLGKLSDADYSKTKLTLQNELAAVLAGIDAVLQKSPAAAPPKAAAKSAAKSSAKADPLKCPHCGAQFDKPMKFCGECGKTMPEVQA